MTGRVTASLMLTACVMAAGCASSGPLAASQSSNFQQGSGWIKMTDRAAAELKRRAKDRPITWVVMYNGTCNGAPSLGFYPAGADAPDGAETFSVSGIVLLVKKKVVGLHDRWGDLLVDCQPQNDNMITVEFSRAAGPTRP